MVFFDVFGANKSAEELSVTSPPIAKPNSRGVNYDDKPTVLYNLIEKQKWPLVLERNSNFPDEAKIWVYRIDEKKNSLRWRMLPLHAAIIFGANDEVIKALIESFPDAVKMCDDRRMLPVRLPSYFLHLSQYSNFPVF